MKKACLAALALAALPALSTADVTFRAGFDLSQQSIEREQRGLNVNRGGRILVEQDLTLEADLLPQVFAEAAWRVHPSTELFTSYAFAHTDSPDGTIDRAVFTTGEYVLDMERDIPTLTQHRLSLGARWTSRLNDSWHVEGEVAVSGILLNCDDSLCSAEGDPRKDEDSFVPIGAKIGLGYRLTEELEALLRAGWDTEDEYEITSYGLGLRYTFR